jgi:hypothetical protein
MSLNLFWQFQIDESLTKQNWKCYRVSWNAFFTEIFTHGTVWGLKSFFLCYISSLMTCATFRYLVFLLLSVSIRDQLVLLWYRFQSSAFVQNKLKRWRLMSVTRQCSTECASTHKTNACIWTSTYPTHVVGQHDEMNDWSLQSSTHDTYDTLGKQHNFRDKFLIGHQLSYWIEILFLFGHSSVKVREQISFFSLISFLYLTFLLTMKLDNMSFKM